MEPAGHVTGTVTVWSRRCKIPSYGDVQTIHSTDQHCTAATASTNADQVRTLLGLPARS